MKKYAWIGLGLVLGQFFIYWALAAFLYGGGGLHDIVRVLQDWLRNPVCWVFTIAIVVLPLAWAKYSGVEKAAESKRIADLEAELTEEHRAKLENLRSWEERLAKEEARVDADIAKRHKKADQRIAQREAAASQREASLKEREAKAEKYAEQLHDQIKSTQRWKSLNDEKANRIRGAAMLLLEHGPNRAAVGQALSILGRPKKRTRKPPVQEATHTLSNLDDQPF